MIPRVGIERDALDRYILTRHIAGFRGVGRDLEAQHAHRRAAVDADQRHGAGRPSRACTAILAAMVCR
jgi:hypothetical protein